MGIDYNELAAELTGGHPDTGAYNADDQLAADELNALNRTRNRTTMTGSEIINEIDKTEFNLATDAERQQVWDIVHLGTVNPFGIEADLMVDVFGGGSATITALQAARKESISRATEIAKTINYSGTITLSHVITARS